MTPERLTDLYDAMEAQARADGLTRQDAEVEVGNRLHQWVQTHCRYTDSQEWFIVFELACRLGRKDTAS